MEPASVGLPEATWSRLPPLMANLAAGLVVPMPTLPAASMVVLPVWPKRAVLAVRLLPKSAEVVVAVSAKMPPTTSSLASEEVALVPMSIWLVVVAGRSAEPLKKVQLTSEPPDEPASVPQLKTPAFHSSLSAVPLQVASPAPVSVPATARLPAASIVVVAVAPKRAALAEACAAKKLVVVAEETVRLVSATRVGSESVISPVLADTAKTGREGQWIFVIGAGRSGNNCPLRVGFEERRGDVAQTERGRSGIDKRGITGKRCRGERGVSGGEPAIKRDGGRGGVGGERVGKDAGGGQVVGTGNSGDYSSPGRRF